MIEVFYFSIYLVLSAAAVFFCIIRWVRPFASLELEPRGLLEPLEEAQTDPAVQEGSR